MLTFTKETSGKPEDCEAAISACVEKLGKLDILFHNAEQPCPLTTVPYHDVALFQQIINTNLCALFYLARVAIPQMQKQGKGVIVATASTSAMAGEHGLPSYSASKAGMVNLMRTMAIDHAKDNIRINAICPGYMLTPMTEGLGELAKVVEESIPQGRGADPAEVARSVLFLASEDASYMTGHGKMTCSPHFLRLRIVEPLLTHLMQPWLLMEAGVRIAEHRIY